jgi:hypothetical protein
MRKSRVKRNLLPVSEPISSSKHGKSREITGLSHVCVPLAGYCDYDCKQDAESPIHELPGQEISLATAS